MFIEYKLINWQLINQPPAQKLVLGRIQCEDWYSVANCRPPCSHREYTVTWPRGPHTGVRTLESRDRILCGNLSGKGMVKIN